MTRTSSLLRPTSAAALLLVLVPSMAWAHPAPGVAHGFLHGFGHPFSGVDHLLAMVAVGLMLGVLHALAVRLPVLACAAIIAGFALFHGATHGVEAASSVGYAAGVATAAGMLHLAGALVATAAFGAVRYRPHAWVRIAGASISTAGLVFMVLGR
jgi:urease accessory protein